MPRALALSASALLLMSLAACGAKAPRPKPLGSLRITLVGAPKTLDPLLVSDASGAEVDSLVYDGLVRVSPGLVAVPDLARRWSISPDGLSYTFDLNPKAVWQDGQPVTAADVVFSYAAYRDPANGSPVAPQLAVVQAVQVVSKRRVVFRLAHPFAPFLLDIAPLPILPEHLLGKQLPGTSLLQAPALTTAVVGSGPFRLVALRHGQFDLRRNPRYFLGAPQLAKLQLVVEPDIQSALAALRAGKLDLAPVPPVDAPAVATWPGVHLASVTGLAVSAVVWNVTEPPFSSAALRRALYYAVNRPAILHGALGGYGKLADGPVPPDSWAFDASVGHRPYDPREALTLLRSLGYYRGKDGMLRSAAGRPLRLSILASQGNAQRTVALGEIARNLEAIGIATQVRYESWPNYLQDFISGNFQAVFAERGLTPDPDVTAYFGSAAVNSSGQNPGGYSDPTVDHQLVLERRTATDTAARALALRAVQQALAVDPPALFLYFPDYVDGLSRHFAGYQPSPTGSFYAPERWRRRS